MRQRMLEGVLDLREEVRFVEELGSLKVRETATEIPFVILDDGLEQSERYVLADHGGSLDQALLRRWEPVDAPGQQRLHRRRDLDRQGILDHAVAAALARDGTSLHQRPDTLFEEEWVALGPFDQQTLEGGELGAVAHQGKEQFLGALRRQGVDPELAVVGLATPAVAELGAIVDEEQHWCRGHALQQVVEYGLRLRIDPVEILQHEDAGLDLALAEEQALHRIECELAALGRLEAPEAVLRWQGVKKPENGRDHVLECLVQGEQMSGGLGAYRAGVVTLVDTEIGLQEIDDRKIAGSPAIGDSAGLEDPAPGDTVVASQLVEEAGLA